MKEQKTTGLGRWLAQKCQKENLSLRQAAARTRLSHATIQSIINGGKPSPETIRRLAEGFSGNGDNQRQALEDKLLILAGFRRPRAGEELSEPRARLLDTISDFTEHQLKIMSRFADFIISEEMK